MVKYMQTKILWLETGDLYTVRRGIEAGNQLDIQVDSLEMLDISFVATGDSVSILSGTSDLVRTYDALIMRSFMPHISEALTVARLFNEAGKVVVDKSLTEEGYAMSKMHDYLVLAKNEIPIPNTWQFFDPDEIEALANQIGFPCILKGIHGAEGRHVHLVNDMVQLRRKMWQYRCGELLLQEYLPAEVDYRVMVVGYKALPLLVKRKPQPGEFRTNFEFNEEITPMPVEEFPELKRIAEDGARILKREFAGVDIRFRGNVPLILEVNRRPGFKGFEKATNLDVAGEFIKYVSSKLTS
jgi:RimK family alpha-L-glutamate ligase